MICRQLFRHSVANPVSPTRISPTSLLMDLLNDLAAGLLSVLYPPVCHGCHHGTENPKLPLCESCRAGLNPADEDDIMQIIGRLPTASPGIDGGCSIWMFEQNSPLQRLIHQMKYENRPTIGVELGRILGRVCAERWAREAADPPELLCPVPLFRTRYLERGYNQSAYLARGVGNVLEREVLNGVLIRSRVTRSQTNLNRTERWNNVRTAFAIVDAEVIDGRTVLLIDDILTTGSTLAAAAGALRQAGAVSVHTATAAVARRYKKERSSHY